MLIRSQDKKRIVNIDTCHLIGTVSGIGEALRISIDGMIIGDYSTEEKAIKVLDMICDRFQNVWDVENGFISGGTYFGSVFKMPQDDEV